MKVIQEGTGKRWWWGEHVTCEGCGRVVELEEGDVLAFAGKESISLKCDACKDVTDLRRKSVSKEITVYQDKTVETTRTR